MEPAAVAVKNEPAQGALSRSLSRFGLWGTVGLVTTASVLASMAVTMIVMSAFLGGPTGIAIVMSAIVPALCAPVFTVMQLRLVVQLQEAQGQLRTLTITDELSGASNRRHFLQAAEQESARARRYATSYSVVLLDLDEFKALNDRYGHSVGDHALRALSDVCRETLRANDIFARFGGEEFVALLPNTDRVGAMEIAERLRRRIADTSLEHEGTPLRLTASFGVAEFSPELSVDELLAWADRAMYVAKASGKNCVRAAAQERGAATRTIIA